MHELSFEGINESVSSRMRPFFTLILERFPADIHSLYVTGSALTRDFSEKHSDVNSLIALNSIKFEFLKFLAPLGREFGTGKVAAPLLMTPAYIQESLDVFPMEFLDLKMIHRTVYGPDILQDVVIDKKLLRLQCEREIKSRLMGLRQGYVSHLGDADRITRMLSRSITGCIPLLRAILLLKGAEPPVGKLAVINSLSHATGISDGSFITALSLKDVERADILALFEDYYRNLEALSVVINALEL